MWVFGGAIFIGKAMRSLPQEVSKIRSNLGWGRYMGILERIHNLLTFILYQAVTGIAFVLMAKSLTRYQELNNKSFCRMLPWGNSLEHCSGL